VETDEKEVQDVSCQGSGGVPQMKKVPQDWGIRRLIEIISAVSICEICWQGVVY
jgi:hypothetical protein